MSNMFIYGHGTRFSQTYTNGRRNPSVYVGCYMELSEVQEFLVLGFGALCNSSFLFVPLPPTFGQKLEQTNEETEESI